MKYGIAVILVLILGFLLVYIGPWMLISIWPDGDIKLCTIDVGLGEAYVDIWTESFQEIQQDLFYTVRIGENREVIPLTYFGWVEIGRQITAESFVLKTARDGKVVGLALADDPAKILIVYDFRTGDSWPRTGDAEGYPSTRERERRLKAMLREDTNQ